MKIRGCKKEIRGLPCPLPALSDQIDTVPWLSFTPADWSLLPRMAQAEGVAPLMHWKLKSAECEVPGAVLSKLAEAFYSNVVSNTLLFRELDRILVALNEANIPVIMLKGAALAQTLPTHCFNQPRGAPIAGDQNMR